MPATKVDGRSDRSARTHEKIIEALFQLVGEGTIRPRAEEIAERADVAVRTLFRHFDDMDGLIAAGRDFLTTLFETRGDQLELVGTLEERARGFAKQQCELFEGVRNYVLFYAANSRTIHDDNRFRTTTGQERRLRVWTALPECAAATAQARTTVEFLFSFQHWDQLRYEQGLSENDVVDSITWSTVTLLQAGARNING
jgi:TetR/AcrR family transcriptional regulator, regulator of autoinduction and epiphytic fitness